jgi:hypothetical protein
VSVLISLSGYLSPIIQLGPGVGWLSPLADQVLSFSPTKKETGKAAWHAEK